MLRYDETTLPHFGCIGRGENVVYAELSALALPALLQRHAQEKVLRTL